MLNLEKDKNYLLACSYGPDSMALFDMLLKGGYHFSAALVNYHLRPESSDEMYGFIKYCEKHKISYHVKDIVNGVKDLNIESECRRIRYQFFADLVAKFKYDAVLVAHNQDDVIETYLMQKKRQNLVIFYGIKEKIVINNTLIIRPLLDCSKAELTNYCHDYDVPFMVDSSNFDERFLRNKIRHSVVAKMSLEERTKILEEIAAKNRELSLEFDKLSHLDITSAKVLATLNDYDLAYALNLLIKKVRDSLYVSMKQVKNLRKVLSHSNGNVEVPIRSGVVLRNSYGKIGFFKPGKTLYSYEIEKPCEFDCEHFYLRFTGDTSNRHVTEQDYPLTIRNYRKNDTYVINNYVVKVRRLFIDWKMPLSLRQRWPIIVNRFGKIIYIPRYQKDFKPDENTNFYVK